MPAPLGPSTATTSPGSMREVDPSNDLDVAVARPEPAGLDERAHVVTSCGQAPAVGRHGGRTQVRVDHRGVAGDLRRSALRDLSPEVQHDDAVAGLQQQRHVVLDEEDPDAAAAGHRSDRGAELGAFVVVQPRGRLVQQQHRGLGDQRTGDADEPCHAVGQRRRPLVEHVGSRPNSSMSSFISVVGLRPTRHGRDRAGSTAAPDRRPRPGGCREPSSPRTARPPATNGRSRPAPGAPPTSRRSTSSPKRTDPADGAVNPVTTSSSVVLPAPFGPIRPTTSPGSTAKLIAVERDDARRTGP